MDDLIDWEYLFHTPALFEVQPLPWSAFAVALATTRVVVPRVVKGTFLDRAHTPATAGYGIQILRPLADWSFGPAPMFFACTIDEVQVVVVGVGIAWIAAVIHASRRGTDTQTTGFQRKLRFGTELEVDRFHREKWLRQN